MTDDNHITATTESDHGNSCHGGAGDTHAHPGSPNQPREADDPITLLDGGDTLDEVPVRMPSGVWAWLVTAVNLDLDDEPTLLQGCWVTEQPPANP